MSARENQGPDRRRTLAVAEDAQRITHLAQELQRNAVELEGQSQRLRGTIEALEAANEELEATRPLRVHAGAAIVGRATAKSDNDLACAAVSGGQNHFANAKGGRANRISFACGQSPHAGGFAHLHHRKFFSVDPSIFCADLAVERIVRVAIDPATTTRFANHFRGAFAAVRHWHDFDVRIRQHIEKTFRNVLPDLSRVQRAFEFVRSDENSHGYNFTRCVRSSP